MGEGEEAMSLWMGRWLGGGVEGRMGLGMGGGWGEGGRGRMGLGMGLWSADAMQMPHDMPPPYSKMMEGGYPGLKIHT